MLNYKILACPNCGGVGCPTCNNTGKVKVAADQLQKLKQMMGQQAQPSLTPRSFGEAGPTLSTPSWLANLSGIIAFSLLSVLAGSAAASWWFLKTLKPFFAGLISLLILAGSYLASKQPFFQKAEPNDFLKAIRRP